MLQKTVADWLWQRSKSVIQPLEALEQEIGKNFKLYNREVIVKCTDKTDNSATASKSIKNYCRRAAFAKTVNVNTEVNFEVGQILVTAFSEVQLRRIYFSNHDLEMK